ncbi:hypothetical protein CL634_09010 [bacterium]|nr:hypothetical protein [bacterium]
MIIAHIPAGYLVGKASSLFSRKNRNIYMCAGILGSFAPDLDVIYFYQYTDHTVNHHYFWSHIPYYWMVIAGYSLFLLLLLGKRSFLAGSMFFLNVFLHLALDTVVGGIAWRYPKDDTLMRLIDVPAKLNPTEIYDYGLPGWILNIANHWTFQIELAIVFTAAIVFSVSCIHRVVSSIKNRSRVSYNRKQAHAS